MIWLRIARVREMEREGLVLRATHTQCRKCNLPFHCYRSELGFVVKMFFHLPDDGNKIKLCWIFNWNINKILLSEGSRFLNSSTRFESSLLGKHLSLSPHNPKSPKCSLCMKCCWSLHTFRFPTSTVCKGKGKKWNACLLPQSCSFSE